MVLLVPIASEVALSCYNNRAYIVKRLYHNNFRPSLINPSTCNAGFLFLVRSVDD